MKKKVAVLLTTIAISAGLTGCIDGDKQEADENTKWNMLLNSGSCFVFTFRDNETGVWYISTTEGVTPRLNADGTLYVSK